MFDRLAARLVLVLVLPTFAAIALAIRRYAGGPVFFRQTGVGQNGCPFPVWKFRTAAVEAEGLGEQLETLNEAAGVLLKVHRDPPVTGLGAWPCRWSLDELPQLFNVLIGDLPLVGPGRGQPCRKKPHAMETRCGEG